MDYSRFLNDNTCILGGVKWYHLTEERMKNEKCLERYGYKVFSQNDEDGIIQEIFRRIGVTNKVFVEFGVQNGLESNCHYLLYQNWRGLWIEGNPDYVKEIEEKFRPVIANGQLRCCCQFITQDNINDILKKNGQRGEIDFLSIDIDGNDYYVWDAISVIEPRVVAIEYNGKFPPDLEWKMAYNQYHIWDGSDWHGASLKALEKLGRDKGYQLVGTNLTGANAFFVKEELVSNLFYQPACAEELYNPLRLNIIHRSSHPARYCLKGQKENLGLFNYTTNRIIAGYGFYGQETNGDKIYRWTAGIESQILIRRTRSVSEWISISYFLAPELLQKESGVIYLNTQCDEAEWKTHELRQTEGTFDVFLPDCSQAVSELKLQMMSLWKPSELLGTADSRELGIAIIFE